MLHFHNHVQLKKKFAVGAYSPIANLQIPSSCFFLNEFPIVKQLTMVLIKFKLNKISSWF